MTKNLEWTTNDVANTRSHTYRVETIGNNSRVIYSKIGDNPAFVSSDFDSVEAAKQWAQNYHNKYGENDE